MYFKYLEKIKKTIILLKLVFMVHVTEKKPIVHRIFLKDHKNKIHYHYNLLWL